jgi:transposase InsO family protein
MKLFDLKPQRRRRQPEKQQDLNQAPMAIPNLVKGIIINAPNQVWVSDFTYLAYYGRFVYMATLEDVFTRQVVGFEVSARHNADLVAQALINALEHCPAPQICHSDQGSEYCSKTISIFLKALASSHQCQRKPAPGRTDTRNLFTLALSWSWDIRNVIQA